LRTGCQVSESHSLAFTQEHPLNSHLVHRAAGLERGHHRLGASAHDITNLGTAGFKRDVALQSTLPGGGVTTRIAQAAVPGSAIEDDMVGMLVAKHSFLANLAVFKTVDAMVGELLDRVA
jgi:flagellar basal body rod protein FlgG